jgi:hypothetical protein
MHAQGENNGLSVECKVVAEKNGYFVSGQFDYFVPTAESVNELDHIEQWTEQIGQEFKRVVCVETLQAADARNSECFRTANGRLRKHGSSPFTIIAKCGRIKIERQRMFDPQTGQTMIPSAIVWKTSQNRHITEQTLQSACDASQDVSYRKAARQLAKESGKECLIAASTVWKKKQQKGKELQQKQDTLIEQALKQPEKIMSVMNTNSTSKPSRVPPDTIQLQADEVLTKSQQPGKKTNQTFTATLENTEGNCFYLVAKSSEQLIALVATHLTMLGLFAGKRLEVISDGARWITEWIASFQDTEITRVLCWYHLRKRIYEAMGAVGLAKDRRKELEYEILGHLWQGELTQAVWILWGLRSTARNPKRIDDLIGYLLRKKRWIVNYADRRSNGLWIASTRVEKWNDLAVATRCKHRGMSWTESGVMAIALYAAERKQAPNPTITQFTNFKPKSHTTM